MEATHNVLQKLVGKLKQSSLVIVLVGFAVFLTAMVGLYELSVSPLLCNSCHIMKPYVQAWKTSKHKDVTCVNCHYPPGLRDTIWVKYQALSQVVKWATQTYSSKPFAEVEDGSCLRSGCHDHRLLDGKVEFKRGIIFDHGPHLKEKRRGRQLRCTSCHSQIVVGTHIEVTTTTCFLCHFKGKKNPREFHPLGGCTNCHNAPKGDIEVLAGITFNHESVTNRKVACEKCHLNVVDGSGEAPRERCYTCHNEPEKLEKFDDIPFMHDHHVTGHNVACVRCHSEIKHELPPPVGLTVGWLLDWLPSPSGAEAAERPSPQTRHLGQPPAGRVPEAEPRHKKEPRQLDCKACHQSLHRGVLQMYMGMNGRGTPVIPSHMLQVRVECVACHVVPEREGIEAAVVGQTFRPSESACLECHGEKYKGMLEDWTETIKTMLEAVKKKFKEVAKVLAAVPPKHPELAKVRKLVADANFNMGLVEHGKGVHNVFFAADLLKVANGYLDQSVSALGKPPVKMPEDILVRGGYCAILCHKKAEVTQSETVKFGLETVPHVQHVADFGATCTDCHSADQHQAVTATKSTCLGCHHRAGNDNDRCLACHDLQKAFLEGSVEVEAVEASPSVHADATDCVGCHDVTVKHSRKAVTKQCASCHEEESYISQLEAWAKELKRGLQETRDLVRKGEVSLRRTKNGSRLPGAQELLDLAKADVDLVTRAGGVHNFDLAKAILDKARKEVEKARSEGPRQSGKKNGSNIRK